MIDEYLQFYLLSYFDLKKVITDAQIIHVFHAKRTPSMFYLIEMNRWHHGFSLTNKITGKQLLRNIRHLADHSYLLEKGKGFILTEKGQQICKEYFKDHYYPQKIKSFTNAKVRMPFWNRYQLFTQVFSEYSYQNTKYVPIVKHPHHQENVRQLFHQFNLNKEQLLKYWYIEQRLLFEQMDEQLADVLVNQLTGHGFIGKTRAQLATHYQMSSWEFVFYFMDIIEEFLQLIHKNKEELPLSREILRILHQETYLGLSESTFKTYKLFKKGFSISEIAIQRSIKENTVRQHILEIAFIFKKFPYQNFIPSNIYEGLNQGFEEIEGFTYRYAMNEISQLEFMHYRLVELERMRSK